jgi:hypothetical protein
MRLKIGACDAGLGEDKGKDGSVSGDVVGTPLLAPTAFRQRHTSVPIFQRVYAQPREWGRVAGRRGYPAMNRTSGIATCSCLETAGRLLPFRCHSSPLTGW